MGTLKSGLTGEKISASEKISGKSIRESIFNLIKKDHPEFDKEDFISTEELNKYREKYIEDFLRKQLGELTEMEKTVMDSLKEKSTLTDKLDEEVPTLNLGQKIADKVATFGGSWTFILSFISFLILWILINILQLMSKAFDPYPFILLNLILSTIAAIQAPVIMMSQNRTEEKDRDRAKKDYMINLKSELEIRMLHEKIDHLILLQQNEVFDVLDNQAEILKEIKSKLDKIPEK